MSETKEAGVRAAIQEFHNAFDDGFTGPAEYATEDWNHINPYGGRDRGREATLKTVRQVHQTFLKGTTDTIDDLGRDRARLENQEKGHESLPRRIARHCLRAHLRSRIPR